MKTPLRTVREPMGADIGSNYHISRNGVVYSKPRIGTQGGIVKTWVAQGYEMIRLHENGKARVKSIHRLLAEAFIPNPQKLPEVNHKDGNTANNLISNLEWCTGRENKRHAYRIGLRTPTSVSGEKYISKDKINNKWRVIINNPDGSKSRVGRYKTLEEAKVARDLILKKYA